MSVFGVVAMASCSRRAPSLATANQAVSQAAPPVASGTLEENRPPSALVQIGKSAEEVFDAARTSQSDVAVASVGALKESFTDVNVSALKPDLAVQLRSRIRGLESSINARQRVQSMDFANGITRLVADLSAPYQVEIPYKIVLLDYYGRQLELGIAAARPAMLKQATADVRQTWNSIEPDILRRGHVDDGRRFSDIVVQLEEAEHPADFVAPARAELAAVGQLEKILKP